MATQSPRSPWLYYLAGLGWSSIFGLSFLVTKGALRVFTPFELLFLRFTLAAAAIVALRAIGAVKLSFRGADLRALVPVCLFQPFLYFLCETYGLGETASGTAGIILGALPAAVAAASAAMLKERLSAKQAAGLLVSVAGVVAIVASRAGGANEGADSLRGLFLIVGALASAAFYNVFSRKASASLGPAEITFAMMATGAVGFGALALAQDLAVGRRPELAEVPLGAWGAVAYLGLLSSVLAFFLVNLSLSRLKASQASVFGTLTTLISVAAGAILRGESLGPAAIAGAFAIVGGVWATNRGKPSSRDKV